MTVQLALTDEEIEQIEKEVRNLFQKHTNRAFDTGSMNAVSETVAALCFTAIEAGAAFIEIVNFRPMPNGDPPMRSRLVAAIGASGLEASDPAALELMAVVNRHYPLKRPGPVQ